MALAQIDKGEKAVDYRIKMKYTIYLIFTLSIQFFYSQTECELELSKLTHWATLNIESINAFAGQNGYEKISPYHNQCKRAYNYRKNQYLMLGKENDEFGESLVFIFLKNEIYNKYKLELDSIGNLDYEKDYDNGTKVRSYKYQDKHVFLITGNSDSGSFHMLKVYPKVTIIK